MIHYKKHFFSPFRLILLSVALLWNSSNANSSNRPHTSQPEHTTHTMNVNREDRELQLSKEAQALAKIETVLVKKAFLNKEIRLVGKIAYDESRVKTITSWFPGRIEKLYIDFTGTTVGKNQILASIYSPELISAQSELITALKFKDYDQGVKISKEKLKLLGLDPVQIASIEKLSEPENHINITSPLKGTVIGKYVNEGEYIKTGSILYIIADLTHVWVLFDAYESDLPWLKLGEEIKVEVEAYPGKEFLGKISFIDPFFSKNTRTVKVRAEIPNDNGLLKPEMFVTGIVSAKLSGNNNNAADEINPPLIIPASAVLKTGKRALVYIEVPDSMEPTYIGREIVLGPKASEYYIVEAGLMEGERVVTKGNFKIDSALQIKAKKSMMNPEGGQPAMGHSGHKM